LSRQSDAAPDSFCGGHGTSIHRYGAIWAAVFTRSFQNHAYRRAARGWLAELDFPWWIEVFPGPEPLSIAAIMSRTVVGFMVSSWSLSLARFSRFKTVLGMRRITFVATLRPEASKP
jgi:hypothetical protein